MDEYRLCKQCRFVKPHSHFYASNQTKCKECVKSAVRSNRTEKIDYYRQYDRDRAMRPDRVLARATYIRTEDGREAHKRAANKWEANNPQRKKAANTVGNAIRDGKLKRHPCWVCGEKAHAHHPDYSRPLDVVWLCPKHHKEAHKVAA